MRFENWNPNKFDESFENIAIDRLVDAGEVVAVHARNKCPTGATGRLKKSIRVVRKRTKSGKSFSRKRNVRIYAGNKEAFYALWVELGTHRTVAQPFLRPAFYSSMSDIKSILGVR